MTTLIDDGLSESCLDDPISPKDFEQFTVIDIDNIDATIEDPGYILDEVPDTFNQDEEYTSSYKKRCSTLPVTFFDISRNISLLKKCRPISIKIVDCHIYPWYYKEIRNKIKNNMVSPKDNMVSPKDNQYKVSNDTTDLITSTNYDTKSTPPKSFSNIYLSSEQRSVLLKLKEKFKNESNANKNIVDNVHNGKNNKKNHEDSLLLNKNTSEYGFDRRIESEDLLKYKAIAQTIVRNIDHNEANLNLNKDRANVNDLSINVEEPDKNNIGKEKEEREKIITSPILPYNVKLQKKTKTKGGTIGESSKANSVLEKCTNKFMSSSNQVIPHYHCTLPVPGNNNDKYYCTSMIGNQMNTQTSITQDPSLYYQPLIKNGILSGNSESIPARNSQERLVTSPNRIEETSYLDCNKIPFYNPLLNSSQITKQQLIENINPNIHTPNSPNSLYYQNNIHTASEYQGQKVKNGNSLRLFRRPSANQFVSKESCQVFSHPCSFSKSVCHNYIPNSMCLLNKYVNYSKTQIPLQRNVSNMTNIIQNNPLLSQLLNCNNLTEYYQSTMEPCGELVSGSVVGRIPPPSKEQNYRLPLRLPPPPSSYNYYLHSTQYAQNNRFEHSNAGMNLHCFSNPEDTNLLQHRTNSCLRYKEIPNEVAKGENNLKNIHIDAPRITDSMTPRVYSMKRNICAHKEMPNINHISSASHEVTDPEILISMKTKINKRHTITVSTESAKAKYTKISNKNNIDALINVLNNKKSNCVNSKMDKCNIITQNKISIFKKNTFNSLVEQKIPDRYQSDTKPIIDGASKVFNTVLHPTKNGNIATSEQVQSTTVVNGYSPPILPIPSFKKSLEMLSELKHAPAPNSTTNTYLGTEIHKKTCSTSRQRTKGQDCINIIRKRKLNNDETMFINSKRISLQEYKLRRSENVITLA